MSQTLSAPSWSWYPHVSEGRIWQRDCLGVHGCVRGGGASLKTFSLPAAVFVTHEQTVLPGRKGILGLVVEDWAPTEVSGKAEIGSE